MQYNLHLFVSLLRVYSHESTQQREYQHQYLVYMLIWRSALILAPCFRTKITGYIQPYNLPDCLPRQTLTWHHSQNPPPHVPPSSPFYHFVSRPPAPSVRPSFLLGAAPAFWTPVLNTVSLLSPASNRGGRNNKPTHCVGSSCTWMYTCTACVAACPPFHSMQVLASVELVTSGFA